MNARSWLLALSAVVALSAPAFAKSADDYFHGASYKYVAGKRQDAKLEVEEGLRRYPGDARLKGLNGQLQDLDDKQKNSGQKNDEGKDKDKNDPNKKDPGKDKDKNKDQDKDKKDDEKNKDKDKQDKDKQEPRDDADKKDGKNPGGARPGEMSKDEAQRLLNSFAEDEKKEQRDRQKLLHKRLETEQDW